MCLGQCGSQKLGEFLRLQHDTTAQTHMDNTHNLKLCAVGAVAGMWLGQCGSQKLGKLFHLQWHTTAQSSEEKKTCYTAIKQLRCKRKAQTKGCSRHNKGTVTNPHFKKARKKQTHSTIPLTGRTVRCQGTAHQHVGVQGRWRHLSCCQTEARLEEQSLTVLEGTDQHDRHIKTVAGILVGAVRHTAAVRIPLPADGHNSTEQHQRHIHSVSTQPSRFHWLVVRFGVLSVSTTQNYGLLESECGG